MWPQSPLLQRPAEKLCATHRSSRKAFFGRLIHTVQPVILHIYYMFQVHDTVMT